jgi:hypothetical protein
MQDFYVLLFGVCIWPGTIPDSLPEAAACHYLQGTSSNPLAMHNSCLGLSLMMRAGFTVMTLIQSNNPPNGK